MQKVFQSFHGHSSVCVAHDHIPWDDDRNGGFILCQFVGAGDVKADVTLIVDGTVVRDGRHVGASGVFDRHGAVIHLDIGLGVVIHSQHDSG